MTHCLCIAATLLLALGAAQASYIGAGTAYSGAQAALGRNKSRGVIGGRVWMPRPLRTRRAPRSAPAVNRLALI